MSKNKGMLLIFVPLSLFSIICKGGIINFIFVWIIYFVFFYLNILEEEAQKRQRMLEEEERQKQHEAEMKEYQRKLKQNQKVNYKNLK